MMNKSRILFVVDKWWSGNINYGLSEWEGNLWQSLKAVNLAEIEVFHFDEYYRTNEIKGDEALLSKIAEFQPQLICLVIYNLPDTVNTPSLKTLETIKKCFSIPIFAIWGDFECEEQVKISDVFQPFIDFNMFTATSVVFRRWQDMKKDTKKFSYFWVPKNPNYFYNPNKSRDLEISYPGSPKPDRLRKIRYLEKHGLEVFNTGGETQNHLPITEFSKIFQRSKIILSFCRSGYTQITCARTFEATNCGAMLLEEASPETAKLFIPYVDYVPYFSNNDLLKKARYYLQNETERLKIANSGHLKTQQYYSAYRFWKIVLAKAEEVISARLDDKIFDRTQLYQLDQADDQLILINWGIKTIELPWQRLIKLPLFQAMALKITDWFCSYKLSYFFYLCYQRIKDWRWLLFNCSYACFKVSRSMLPKKLGARLKKSLKPCLKFVKTN
ncbi:MAG: glycosyltransferase [Candidatus Omnitrophica bacterium]|nr:glycosyltransferase [Candidatus Omnitrophota bacterium]